jgi:hypothetical protein
MPRQLAILTVAALCLPLVASAAAPVFEDAVLISTDGWRYEHVQISLAADGQAVAIRRPDGAVRHFTFAEVARIEDAEGNDVTGQLITPEQWERSRQRLATDEESAGAGHVPGLGEIGGGERIRWERTRVHTQALRPFDATVGGGLGFGFPSGKWYGGFDNGLALHLQVRAAITERGHISVGFRRQNLGSESGYIDGFGVVEAEVHANEYFLLIGLHGAPEPPRRAIGFLEAGIGSGDHVLNVTADGQEGSASESRTVFLFQGGVILPMGGRLGIELGANLMWKPPFFSDQADVEGAGAVIGFHFAGVALLGGEVER